MIPIQELLARIRHDRAFGRGRLELGYFDRRQNAIQRVALDGVTFPEGERRVLEVTDETGQLRRIPFHRVREVWRDGRILWKRPAQAPPAARSGGHGDRMNP